MKYYTLTIMCLLLLFACKTNKVVEEGTELNLEERNESTVQRPEGSIAKIDQIIEAIDMNQKHEEKFREIYYHYQEKRLAVRKKGGKPHMMLKEVLAMRDEQNRKVKKLLNDEQYERYLIAINDKKGRPVLSKPQAPKM